MLLKLGRILLLLLWSIPLFASLKVVAPSEVNQGEDLIFKIIARGVEIEFPQIDFIGKHLVEEVSSSSEAYMIDTQKATQITKTYKVKATKTFFIPSYSIKIDKEIQKTKAKKIVVKKITKTISPDYDLQMQINKTKVYVGEQLILKMIFTFNDDKLEDYNFITPEFENFTLKEKSENSLKTSSGKYIEILEFYLFTKQAGSFILPASKVEIEIKKKVKTFKRFKLYKKMIYSNTLNLEVFDLGENVSVVGHYDMKTTLNKQKVKKGEPVKMQLLLNGEGNLNTLETFTFNIPNTTVYAQLDANNTLHKHFEIISNNDFIIPSLSLTYFNTLQQKIVTIKTPSYQILVGDTRDTKAYDKPKKSVKTETEIHKKEITNMEKLIYFLLGISASFILIYIYIKINSLKIKNKESKLLTSLKKIKKQEDFFKKLIPFIGKNKDLDRMIYKLEKNDIQLFKRLKKDILKLVKILKI